jgi:hypothetical protein
MADIEQASEPVRTNHAASESSTDSSQADIEQLGRERPPVFKNAFVEIGFCMSVLASNLVSVCAPTDHPGLYQRGHAPPLVAARAA